MFISFSPLRTTSKLVASSRIRQAAVDAGVKAPRLAIIPILMILALAVPFQAAQAGTVYDSSGNYGHFAPGGNEGCDLSESFQGFDEGLIVPQPLSVMDGYLHMTGNGAEIAKEYDTTNLFWEAEPRYYSGISMEPSGRGFVALGFYYGLEEAEGYWKFTYTDGWNEYYDYSEPEETESSKLDPDQFFVGWVGDEGEVLLSVVWVGDDGEVGIEDMCGVLAPVDPEPKVLEPSDLCLIVDPNELVCGEYFTVAVAIDSKDLFDDCGACDGWNGPHAAGENDEPIEGCGDGFTVKNCGNNIAGVVSGKVGLTFTPGKINYKSAMLGGVGPSVHVPTGVMTFASQGDGWARFSFSVPIPPDNTIDENTMINGRGKIVTFTFKLPEDASNFKIGIDPANTEFILASTDPPDDDGGYNGDYGEGCALPKVPYGYEEGKWPVNFPPLVDPWITCQGAAQIYGTVEFWNCSKPTNVPFTTLTLNTNLAGDEALVEISDSKTGEYTFNVTPFNNYQLSGDPPYGAPDGVFRADDEDDFGLQGFGGTTDVRDAITAADVGQIMLHWNDPVGFPLNACAFEADPACGGTIYPQRVAADVNGWLDEECADYNNGKVSTASDGVINGADASILQQVIAARILGGDAMPEGYPLFEAEDAGDCASNWRFFCANKTFGLIPEDGVEYNPIGVLIGDVNGSYTNDPNVPRKPSKAKLSIPVVTSKEKSVLIPVELTHANSIVGIEAKILYDEKALRFVRAHAPVSVKTDEATNHAWAVSDNDGALALVVTGLTAPLQGSSTVALLEFERTDMTKKKVTTPILIADAHADDVAMKTDSGFFTSTSVRSKTWGEVKSLFRDDDEE